MFAAIVLTCALGAVVYCVLRKTWYFANTYWYTLIYMMKYNVIGALGILHDIWNMGYNRTDLPPMPTKIAIVTGGSRGIGLIAVKKLLQCDMEVIMACRTIIAGEKAVLQIRKSGITSGRVKVLELDNSSLESVREFVERIKMEYDKVHILINNAGIMFTPYQKTKDGLEEQWAVNYLSHFLLTSLLLPLLQAGGRPDDCSRIINVTSCAYVLGNANFSDMNFKEECVKYAMYAQSKLAQVVFTTTLHKLLTDKSLNIRIYTVHPGLVKTDLFNTTYLGKVKFLMIGFKTPEQGATPIVYTAVNKDIGVKGGLYISNCREQSILQVVMEPKVQSQLFALSLKQAKLNDFFQYLQ